MWIGTTVMLFFAFGLLFLVLFYQNYFIKMKRKEAELLLQSSLESEKKERIRIAADLHDGVSGDLNAIRNYLSVLQRGEKDEEKQELFAEIKEGIEAALENTRQVSYKLMPPLLELAGFKVALEDYFGRLTTNSKIAFEFVCNTEAPDFSNEIAYELFRVVQELTTNMIKYGGVTHCLVLLSSPEAEYSLEIIDNGIPFDFYTSLKTSKGSGLKNISSRLKVIGAQMKQKENPKGNHYIITLKR
ncbi:histidine kinase [Flavobacterium amniphilum]|uniref:sensor histidine kinase n=1 Tax=Flavobacterium amniphilum TaxID=1834035 RepID=UPI00202AC23F|nr:histidine kinase [Flavobacterium amniphilum]MCL9807626.1 histidine kinase [Flavobacterium amniphilum]